MTLFLGQLLWRKTVGIVGAGRIGFAYARMMAEGHKVLPPLRLTPKMNVLYYDVNANKNLEDFVAAYGGFLKSRGEEPVTCRRVELEVS